MEIAQTQAEASAERERNRGEQWGVSCFSLLVFRSVAWLAFFVDGLFSAYARVGYSVGDIGEEIHSHISESYGQDATLHQGIVAIGDGGQGEAADARPTEDCFSYDGTRKQAAKLQADDCEDRDQRVAQGVAIDNGVFCQAFGASGSDVVLVELFEHGGPDHPGEDGGETKA